MTHLSGLEQVEPSLSFGRKLPFRAFNRHLISKTVISNSNAIEDSNTLTRDTRSNLKIFKIFFLNLADYVISTTLTQ